MFKKSISLVLSIIMLVAMCAFAPVSYAETVTDGDYFTFTQNFNTIYQTAYTPEQYTSNTGLTTTKSGGAGLWIANDDEAGADRVARLDHAGGEAKTSLSYVLPQAVTKDVLSVSFKLNLERISETASNAKIALFRFYSGDTNEEIVYINKYNYNGFSATPGKDADEYHNLRAVVQRAATTEDWEFTIYDDTVATPVVVYQGTLAADSYPSIDKVTLCNTYTEAAGSTYRIDDVEIKSYKYEVEINFTQNFNSIYQTAYTTEQYLSLTGLTAAKSGGGGLWIANDDEAGTDRAARFDHAGGSASTSISYVLPTALTKDALSVSLKMNIERVNAEAPNAKIELFRFYSGSKGEERVYFNKTKFTGLSAEPGLDGDEYYNLRAVVQRVTETEDWEFTIYDDTVATPTVVYTGTLAAADYPYIDKVMLSSTYTETAGTTFRIDDVEIKTCEYVAPPVETPAPTEEPTVAGPVEIDFSQNFNSVTSNNAYTPEQYLSLTGLTATKSGGGGLWIRNDEETGVDRVAELDHAGGSANTALSYVLPQAVTKDIFSVSFKMKIERMNADAPNAKIDLFSFSCGEVSTNTVYINKTNYSGFSQIPGKDADEYYNLRAVAWRAATTDDWEVTIYDDTAVVPAIVYQGTLAADSYPSINTVMLCSTYTEIAGTAFRIDDVEIKTIDSYEGKISQNFDEVSESITTEAELNAETGIVSGNTGVTATIVKKGSNQMLKLSQTPNKSADFKYNIPVMTKGTVSLSLKVGQDGTETDQGVWRIGKIYNGETSTTLIDRHGSATFKKYENTEFLYPFRQNPDTEMYHIRVVVSRNDEDSNWVYQIWDDGGKSHEAPVMIDSGELAKEDYAKIDGIGITGLWSMSDTNILIDDVEINWYKGITLNSVHFGSSGEVVKYMATGISDLTAYIRLHSSDADIEKVTVVMAVYSGEGRLLAVNALPIDQIGPEANETPVTISATGFTTDSASYVQLFFMEDLTSIRPLRAAGGLFADGFCE